MATTSPTVPTSTNPVASGPVADAADRGAPGGVAADGAGATGGGALGAGSGGDGSGAGGPTPPSWPAPPPRPAPRRRRGARIGAWLLVALAILLVGLGAVALTGRATFDLGATTTSTDTYPGVTDVHLSLDNADVEVVVGGTDVVVESRIRTGALNAQSGADVRGETLVLSLDCPVLDWLVFRSTCGGDYAIRVPPGTTIDGSTDNGDLRLRGVDGAVDVATRNGRIDLAATTGPVRVRTANGRITGTSLQSSDVVASTSNGSVELGFVTAPNAVTVDTSNGPIEIVVPADGDGWQIEPRTSNGGVSTDVPIDDDAGRRLTLTTSNGSITVRHG